LAQQSPDHYAFPPVLELFSVDSTNNYALGLLRPSHLTERQENVKHGWAVFSHEQFAGKGQRGKDWLSKTGENIHLSIIIEPKCLHLQHQFVLIAITALVTSAVIAMEPKCLHLQHQFVLIAITALVVRSVFEKYAQSDILIKWPNDIYFQDRKAGGILIENIISGTEWKWAVVGVGLNINQTGFDQDLQKRAVSLRQITGNTFDCLQLATEVRNAILSKYSDLEMQRTSFLKILEEYNQYLFKKNEQVLFEKDGQQFVARVRQVLPSGQLVVQTDIELLFDFGEVSWVLE